jgi:acetolactate synthase-1/2/3 large subunit
LYLPDAHKQPITFLNSISNDHKAVEVADGYGEKGTDPKDVTAALERGLKAVTVEKGQAVINVICSA